MGDYQGKCDDCGEGYICQQSHAEAISKEYARGLKDGQSHIGSNAAGLSCPFCKDNDFDSIGLKSHLSYGHCEVFEATELAARPPW